MEVEIPLFEMNCILGDTEDATTSFFSNLTLCLS